MPDLNQWAERVHTNATRHGFHDQPLNFPEQIAYCHGELSEALTAHQAGQPAAWLNHPSQHPSMAAPLESHPVNDAGQRCLEFQGGMVAAPPDGWAVELVDTLFRVLDLLAEHGIDVEQVAEAKYRYNTTRPPPAREGILIVMVSLRRAPTATTIPDSLTSIVDDTDVVPDEAVTLRMDVLYSSQGGRGQFRTLQANRWLDRRGKLVHTSRPPHRSGVVAFRGLDRLMELSAAGDFAFLPVPGRHSDVHADDCDVCPPATM